MMRKEIRKRITSKGVLHGTACNTHKEGKQAGGVVNVDGFTIVRQMASSCARKSTQGQKV